MEYMSIKQVSSLWGISERRIQVLCNEGRIPNAKKVGTLWLIPFDSVKPDDGRENRYNKEKSSITPIKKSVKAESHTPQYKMHKYFARRPYNVFSNLIKHYTKKNDIVLDCFCGGGVTVFESAALERKPIGVDLNPLAAFVTRMQMFSGDVKEVDDFFRRFLLTINTIYSDWYKVKFDDDEGYALWTEWAYVVKCPICGEHITLVEENKVSNGIYKSNNSKCSCHKGIKRVLCPNVGSIPLRCLYKSDKFGKEKLRKVDISNFPVFANINFEEVLKDINIKPTFEIPDNWDRQHEDKLKEKGVISYKDFFTLRNYSLNVLIFNEIIKLKSTTSEKLNEILYFLFSSSLRYTNNMTRVTDNWEGGKPTAMDKHAFWLPNQYVETNILDVLEKRAKTILKGFNYSSSVLPQTLNEVNNFDDMKFKDSYMVLNRSSSSLPLPDKSVDIIITDPPYGSNVQYAELSTIWNAWYSLYKGLDNYIYRDEEAVVNRKKNVKGAKTEDDYERLLCSVYSEGARVLKDGGYLVFTFNNKNIKVWIAMLKAVAMAGFYLPENGLIFQDYIDSYKNTSHLKYAGNIQGDFIYSFRKGTAKIHDFSGLNISDIISNSVDRAIQVLYRKRKNYSTPDLYQKIMSSLASEMMQYILWTIDKNIPIDEIKEFSNDYIDSLLKKRLICENGIWRKN